MDAAPPGTRRPARRRWRRAGRSAGWRGWCRGRGAGPASPCRSRRARLVEREVAHVVAVDAHRAVGRRRRGGARACAMVVLPAPDGPTSATSWPGSAVKRRRREDPVRRLVARRRAAASASSDAIDTVGGRGWRNHTSSNSTCGPGGDEVVRRRGGRRWRGGESSTSNTRSNETTARQHVDPRVGERGRAAGRSG